MGANRKYTPEEVVQILDDAIEWVGRGQTLRDFCRQDGRPTFHAIYDWLNKNEEARRRFVRAREVGADIIAEEGLAILEQFPLSTPEGRIDSAHVNWLRNRFEGRLKLLAKWFPQKYGEKSSVELTGAEGGPLKVEDTQRSARVAQLLATAKTRKLEDEDFGDLA